MITVSDVSLNFSGQNLFTHVNLQFTPGNCYGVIGANGAGKSTFLRILSGDLEPSSGEVAIDPKTRMSVLRQDHFAYDDQTVWTPSSRAIPACSRSCSRRMPSMPKRIFPRRTASSPPSWKGNSPS